MKKRICFIATDGTIASRETPHGLMPVLTGEELAKELPEIDSRCTMDFVQLLQLDSSNLVPENWQEIAATVAQKYEEYDGFIISHGTDTMAYTSSALHYMLKNLNKPVIVTGSQLPMGVDGSDAPANLSLAVDAATSGRGGVYLAFDGRILLGNRARKTYSQDFHGFDSINAPEAGVLSADGRSIVWDKKIANDDIEDKAVRGTASGASRKNNPLQMNTDLDSRVAVLKLTPGTNPELIRLMADNGYRGLILEAFGAGGIPSDESPLSLLPAIDYAIQKGMLVVCTTQCVYDGVHMNTYEVGIRALEHGVLSGKEATLEALAVRLMLALGQGESSQEAREIFLTQE